MKKFTKKKSNQKRLFEIRNAPIIVIKVSTTAKFAILIE
jgi:hypothetical protein